MLPDFDGIQICREIRQAKVKTPILMLTGKSSVTAKVEALDVGADDYLTKPFNLKELSARIRALTRRNVNSLPTNTISVGDLTLDTTSKIVKYKDKKITLRRKEFRLLEFLMRNQGKVVTREMILEHVWDSNTDTITNTIDVHIKYLRDDVDKPFGTNMIKTIHGLGYKFEA
jgi:two-component system OmpR family response regulator